jgi:single-stranded-DNA-specific exonuclease
LTLPAESLDIFRTRLTAFARERLTSDDLQPTVEIDAELRLAEINDPLWQALEQMAPFGMDNRQPLFAARGVTLAGPPQIWKEKHLRVAIQQEKRTLMMKGWNMADRAAEFQNGQKVDVAFEVERDWMGGWGLTVKAIRSTQ